MTVQRERFPRAAFSFLIMRQVGAATRSKTLPLISVAAANMLLPSQHIVGVYISAQRGAGKRAVARAELIANYGILGDAHAGQSAQRQISLFAVEVLRELAAAGIPVAPESISANIITEGIDLLPSALGTRLRIGEAVIELLESRKPCARLTKLDPRLPKLLYQRCGLMGRILNSGGIYPGAAIVILKEPTPKKFCC